MISVIIPTFNSEKTIDRCLESLTNQNYKNFEIILVDGKSNDDTLKIVKSYLDKGLILNIKTEKDEGPYDAMNKGISMAKGKWIYFLGSDDYLYHDSVLKQFASYAEETRSDLIYGNVFFEPYGRIYDGEFNRSKLIKRNICHQGIFYKKTLFDRLGMYNLKYPVHADWEFNIKCFFSSNVKVEYHDFTVAHFSDGGLSSFEDNYREEMLDFLILKGIGRLSLRELSSVYRRFFILKTKSLLNL
ncbi:glycosyltransferase [Lutimonas saemankumensis]|uniref:glycosyltransferase family 2 protein n=1 Tax=Lutimonas saemankumensis TaxID=483016 RepID=UPI001CD377E9|nr:glycosyltransferase family 2 protein [Lutimonas saemankumensis]MCA0931592.1 glycosyltransferase [Lutimonas saemankumensis]